MYSKYGASYFNTQFENIQADTTARPTPTLQLQGGTTRPLGGGSEVKEVVYCAKATRLDNNTAEFYTGLTGGPSKPGTTSTNLTLETWETSTTPV